MKANIDIKVNKDDSGKTINEAQEALDRALERIGIEAEGQAKLYLTESGAVDTGRLRGSVSHVTQPRAVTIGTNVEYAPYIELGTYKMAARPYLSPAIKNHLDRYKQIIMEELKK